MAAPIRAFLAIQPPADIRTSLVDTLTRIEIDGARLRIVDQDNIHLTIEFLGDIPEGSIKPLSKLLDDVAAQTRPFEAEVVGIAAFPARRPVVVAAVLAENNSLSEVVAEIRGQLCEIGFDPETRPFRPHITIARIKGGRNRVRRFSLETQLTFTADEFVLFRSDLTRKGAQYSRLHSARLER